MRHSVGNSLHDQRVYHRSPRCFQHGKSLYPPRKRKHMEVGGLFRSAHWFLDYRLLRSRFRVVSQLCLRLHYGRIERWPCFHYRLFHSIFQWSYTSGFLDNRYLCSHTFHHCAWCPQWYWEGIQADDAHTLHPLTCHCHSRLPASRCIQGHRLPFEARLLKGNGRRFPWSFGPMFLFYEHRYGLFVHLRQLFQPTYQYQDLCHSNRIDRSFSSNLGGIDDISCCILCRNKSWQRPFAHLYHASQRLQSSLFKCSSHWLDSLFDVLCTAFLSCIDLFNIPPRGQHSFLLRGNAHLPQGRSMDCDPFLRSYWCRLFGIYRAESPHVSLWNGPFRPLWLCYRTADAAVMRHADVSFRGLVRTETDCERRTFKLGNAAL